MLRRTYRLVPLLLLLVIASPVFAQQKGKKKPITVGSLVVNAEDVIAVYRASDQAPVEVFVGKPGHAIQVIIFHDFREAQSVFNDLWANNDVTKNPGEDDARPLTRMKVKDTARGPTTLIANISRILAMVHHPDRREIHIYLDAGAVALPLPDPANNAEREFIEITNSNGEADIVLAAYKECLGEK